MMRGSLLKASMHQERRRRREERGCEDGGEGNIGLAVVFKEHWIEMPNPPQLAAC